MHRVAALPSLTGTHARACKTLQLVRASASATDSSFPQHARAQLLAPADDRFVVRLGPRNIRRVGPIQKSPERLLPAMLCSQRFCLGIRLSGRQGAVTKKDTGRGDLSFDLGIDGAADPSTVPGYVQSVRTCVHPLVALKPER
ncbi:hypothetical protein AGR7C_pTi0207 [Agrobacterium deltaense Zutra 3/1]|uniref:Uncharacterized protein n=1 Tax=Agrobacterium deltaense Zutra 3/1 TaxID=1183427 RepID=A0A1S7S7D9_9HYPH|nr:hypothetical protein AGR7C_pTi0207 [Agrobacterium deltaense Zutra 3/1]